MSHKNLAAVALSIILVGLIFQVLPDTVTNTQQTMLAILVVGATLLFLLRGAGPTLTLSLGKNVKRVITLVLAFTALNLALYMIDPKVPLYNTPEGYGHLGSYVALFIIAAMIDANLEGKAKFAALVMVLITFALIGPRTGMLLSPDGRLWTKLHLNSLTTWWSTPSINRVTNTPSLTSSQCPGTVEFTELGSSWKELPEGRSCRILHEIQGDVEFADSRGSYSAQGWQNRNPLFARARSANAGMYYAWCPLETGTKPLKWGCVPKS